MKRIWWLLEGYGSKKEKSLFVLTFVVLGLFIVVIYVACEMIKGVQQVTAESPLLVEEQDDELEAYNMEDVDLEMTESSNSYGQPQYN